MYKHAHLYENNTKKMRERSECMCMLYVCVSLCVMHVCTYCIVPQFVSVWCECVVCECGECELLTLMRLWLAVKMSLFRLQ